MHTTYPDEDVEFHAVDTSERVSLGPLVASDDVACERCGNHLPFGDRTYLIGRNIGGTEQCCEHCAFVDGDHEGTLPPEP